MDDVEIKLPKLGESIVSATIVQWFKKVGDPVKLDEPLLEVSTDKVNSEIPSPVAGTLKKILAEPEQELDVGAPLAIMSTAESTVHQEAPAVKQDAPAPTSTGGSKRGLFTPVVLRLAREKGIDLQELENIPATGAGGRLSKRDLEKYLEERKAPTISQVQDDSSERIKMTGMRKMIADAMVRSFYTAPHATLVSEIDVSDIVKYIDKEKENFLKTHGFKLSITSFIAQAIAQSVEKFPLINSSVEDDTIVVKKSVNLGIAVSVDQGILVPVIQNCHTLSLEDIAKEVGDLSLKARTGKLDPMQVKQGTITMTNFGMAGALIGMPIIRHPEVAILGVGAIVKRPTVLENETVGVCSMMNLSLTIDHRVIDGMYGCGYLSAIKTHLENAIKNL